MLELARRKLRGLLRFLEKAKKVVVYTDFQDELGEATLVDLPGITPGTNWERFRLKAAAYLKQHQDHIALQRLRRNRPLTPEDLASPEKMLIDSGTGDADDIALAKEQSHGLASSFVGSSPSTVRQLPRPSEPIWMEHNSPLIRSVSLI